MLNSQGMLNCSYNRNASAENKSNSLKMDYHYKILVAASKMYNKAMDFQMELWDAGFLADIEKQGEIYCVYVGDYHEIDGAAVFERYLRMKGYNTLLVAV